MLTLACTVYDEGLLEREPSSAAAHGGSAELGGSASAHSGAGGANAGCASAAHGGVRAGGSSGAAHGGVIAGGSSGASSADPTGGATNGPGGSTSGGSNGSAGEAGAACAGKRSNGICWYLGATRESCKAVCVTHGGVDTAMIAVIGTPAQGGTRQHCQTLASLFGATGTINQGTRTDGLGLGCHFYSNQPWWLSAPDFRDDALAQNGRVICGCNE